MGLALSTAARQLPWPTALAVGEGRRGVGELDGAARPVGSAAGAVAMTGVHGGLQRDAAAGDLGTKMVDGTDVGLF